MFRSELKKGFTEMLDEDAQGNNNVVVLSHGMWQRRFESDPHILGKAISLNGSVSAWRSVHATSTSSAWSWVEA